MKDIFIGLVVITAYIMGLATGLQQIKRGESTTVILADGDELYFVEGILVGSEQK